jgi:hypothetical protein
MTATPRTLLRGLALAATVAGFAAASAGPAQADYGASCPAEPVTQLADGTFIYSNEAGDAGCVTAQVYANGAARVYSVVAAPGWSYQVKSSGGTTDGSRVQVEFTQTATRAKVSVRMEAGRTVIK